MGYIGFERGRLDSYFYYAKDHLGNVRHVDRSTPGRDNGIVQITNYYPFGGILNESFNRVDYQNKLYNGKEYGRMHGLNLYDYSARQYDPAIGQFTSMDPLCEKYYHISPYAYCAGNPVKYVDPDGRDYNVYLDDESKRCVLTATLYVTYGDVDSYNLATQSADFLNNYDTGLSYVVGDDSYTISFNVNVEMLNEGEVASNREITQDENGYNQKTDLNSYAIKSFEDKNTNGECGGSSILVNNDSKNKLQTSVHEMGHAFGASHTNTGLMTESAMDKRRTDRFDSYSIKQMVRSGIKGKVSYGQNGRGTLINNTKYSQKELLKGGMFK